MSGLGVFVGCLVLGVTAIAAIGSIAASVTAAIKADARDLLGGDAEARLAYRPADADEREFLAKSGSVSEVATMRAMARTEDGARRSLIELKAVDARLPALRRGRPLAGPEPRRRARRARRELRSGGRHRHPQPARSDDRRAIKVGEAVLQIRATIVREPDAATGGPHFRAARADLRRGARRNRADPARRAGDISVPAAASSRGRCGSLGQFGASRVPRGGLADSHLWRGLAVIAAIDRSRRAVSEPRRVDLSAGRRRRDRQCDRQLHRRQDRDDRDPQMPGSLEPAGLRRLSLRSLGACCPRHRHRPRPRRAGAARRRASVVAGCSRSPFVLRSTRRRWPWRRCSGS